MEKATKKQPIKPKIQKTKAKVASALNGSPADNLKIIAITGDTGNTTVAHFIHEILSAHQIPTALITNPTDRPISAFTLYRYLSKCLKNGATHVIIEAPAPSLKKQVFHQLPLHMAILTNTVSPNTIGTDTDDLIACKAELFQNSPQFIVLNRDDPQYDLFASFSPKTSSATFGQHKESNIRINRSKLYKKGTEANLAHNSSNFDVATFAIGEEVVSLMAAAAAAASLLDIPDDIIVEGIASYEP